MSERDEREKAWVELQERYATHMEVLRRVTQSERTAQLTQQRLELVMGELKALPDDVPTYKQIGKAYFLEPKASVMAEGEQCIEEAKTEMQTMKQKKATIEKKLVETRKELEEMAR